MILNIGNKNHINSNNLMLMIFFKKKKILIMKKISNFYKILRDPLEILKSGENQKIKIKAT